MKIAVIGAGNVAAYHLAREHEVTVFEAGSHLGGHTHTHAVEQAGRRYAVDTGFIVFNDWTYPNFIGLLDELGVASQPSDMGFSVRDERSGLEYSGRSLDTLFAQRRNLLRPSFWRMLADILRFNREAPALLGQDGGDATLGDYLAQNAYSRGFIEHYIVPMGAAIWSTDPLSMLAFPARYFVRFFHNHGMLSVNERPQWRVIRGGSARYVEALTASFRDSRCAGWRARCTSRRAATTSSASTPPSSPATATRRSRCSPTRRRPSARCWARSATSRTRRCCTPTPGSCRARAGRGPRGTTTCCPRTPAASRSPTT